MSELIKDVVEKIAQNTGMSIDDIRKKYDKIVMTADKNKDGENLFILREIVSEEIAKGQFSNRGQYTLYTKNGEEVGEIRLTVLNVTKANKVEIEYASLAENKGNIRISLKEVLKDVFVNNSYNNLTVKNIFPKTNINEVILCINSNNYASQAIATKNGFQQDDETSYTMTREHFKEIMQKNKNRESDEIS